MKRSTLIKDLSAKIQTRWVIFILIRDRLIEFWKNENFLLPRVSGTLKPVEYAGKNRFSKYSRFLGLNRPWSLVITHSHLTWTMICFRDSYAMHTFSLYFFRLNRAHAFQWEFIRPRSSVLPGGNRIWNIFTIKLQGRLRPRKRAYFEKRFLPAYSTGFRNAWEQKFFIFSKLY